MAENPNRVTWNDLQRTLLLPLLIGGGGLGLYGSNVLSERLNQEIERRRELERRIEILLNKVNLNETRLGILEDRSRRQ